MVLSNLFSDGRKIKNYFISKFSNYIDLEKYATKTKDNELLAKIKIVKTYHKNLPGHISKIKSQCVKDNDTAGNSAEMMINVICFPFSKQQVLILTNEYLFLSLFSRTAPAK